MPTIKSFTEGQSIKIHPASDLFMKGVHYATVKKVGREYVHIFHAWSGRNFKVLPKDLLA